MVDPYAHRSVVFLADVQELDKAVVQLAQLSGVLVIRILQVLERAGRVHIVAGVDAHGLGIVRRHVGHVGIEVHVGNERGHYPLAAQGGVDGHEVFGFPAALGGQADVFPTGGDDALGLLDAGIGVHRRGVGHRLQADGIPPAERRAADIHDG